MREHYIQKKLAVGVQARSTSTRLPRKVHSLICGVPVLDLVMESVDDSVRYINKHYNSKISAGYFLLVPSGDEITEKYDDKYFIIEGPEQDVLARYKKMAESEDLDFIIRITADCPLIPSSVITNVIKCGIMNEYDYLANFFEASGEIYRLVPDGFECEFFSREMLNWACKNAKEKSDKEHVTTLMRSYPEWGKYGVIIPRVPYTNQKLSIDTIDDKEAIELLKSKTDQAFTLARSMFGKTNVHKF